MSQKYRLIIFVRAPVPGTVKTRLAHASGPQEAARAYRIMVEELLDKLRPLKWVELHYTPLDAGVSIAEWLKPAWRCRAQREGDLGARMHHAFRAAFAEGAARVLLIGSDAPAVTTQDIESGWAELAHRDVVLGPAADGGYWLVGLRKPEPELFAAMPWSTPTVLSETVERARRAGLCLGFLRRLADIDTIEDWRSYLRSRHDNNEIGHRAQESMSRKSGPSLIGENKHNG